MVPNCLSNLFFFFWFLVFHFKLPLVSIEKKWGNGPDPQKIYEENGYEYLENEFAGLDYIKGCAIIPESDMNDPMITAMSYSELADYVFADVEAEEL